MVTLTLKNFPDGLYLELRARARRNGRSLTQQAIQCFEQTVPARPSHA